MNEYIKLTEADLTRQCEEYLEYYPNLRVIRVPDAAYSAIFANSHISGHMRSLISSFLKGLPDFIILKPDGEYNQALCVELKVGKNKMSQGQKHFAEKANVKLIYKFDDFVDEIKLFNEG